METSLALQKVLLVTVNLARLLHAERRHGVSSCLDRVDRVLYLLRSGPVPVFVAPPIHKVPSLYGL